MYASEGNLVFLFLRKKQMLTLPVLVLPAFFSLPPPWHTYPEKCASPPPPAFLLAAEAQRGCTGEREQRLSAAFSCVWTSMSLLSRLWVGVGDTSFLLGLTMSPVSIRSHRVGQDDGFIKIRLCGTGTECLGW